MLPLSLTLSLSLFLSFFLAISLSLSLSLSITLSEDKDSTDQCISVCLSDSVAVSVCVYVCLSFSVCLSFCLSFFPSFYVCLFVPLSLFLFFLSRVAKPQIIAWDPTLCMCVCAWVLRAPTTMYSTNHYNSQPQYACTGPRSTTTGIQHDRIKSRFFPGVLVSESCAISVSTGFPNRIQVWRFKEDTARSRCGKSHIAFISLPDLQPWHHVPGLHFSTWTCWWSSE